MSGAELVVINGVTLSNSKQSQGRCPVETDCLACPHFSDKSCPLEELNVRI